MRRFITDVDRKQTEKKLTTLVETHKSTRRKGSLLYESTIRAASENSRRKSVDPLQFAYDMYEAKCDDLEIIPNENAKRRFVDQLVGGLRSKSAILTGLGLTPGCMKPLLTMVYKMKRFMYVDLSLNRLKDQGTTYLANFLSIDPGIAALDLRSNGIGIDGSVALFRSLARNNHLTYLDLSAIDGIERNRIGTLGCKTLSSLIQRNDVLSILNLSMCGVSADGCAFLGSALCGNESLISLDLSSNKFGNAGVQGLFQASGSMGALESINLSHNSITDASVSLITKQLNNNTWLRSLDLSGNQIGKQFLRLLFQALQNGTCLESLSLAKNKFGPECADHLHLLVRDYPSIRHINLAGNPLKDETGAQIAEAVGRNENLESIDLSDTMIGDETGAKFGSILAKHPSLVKLNLNDNRITDKSGPLIAKALKTNSVLTDLFMKNNEMKDASASAFAEAIGENRSITDLDMAFNDFSFKAHGELQKAIQLHKQTIEDHVAEIATRHIGDLKDKEQTLLGLRKQVHEEYVAVKQATDERDGKRTRLELLKQKRDREVEASDRELDELRNQYEKIAEARRRILAEFNEIKQRTEMKEGEATMEFQNISAKRQQVESRLKRAESRNVDAHIAHDRIFDDLRLQMRTLKEQLKQAIADAHAAKDLLIQKEQKPEETTEEQVKEEVTVAVQEQVEKKEAKKPKVQTIEELRRAQQLKQLKKGGQKRRSSRREVKPQKSISGESKSALDELLSMPAPVNASLG